MRHDVALLRSQKTNGGEPEWERRGARFAREILPARLSDYALTFHTRYTYEQIPLLTAKSNRDLGAV